MAPRAFVGGRIMSMDRADPTPDTVVVDGGRILATGDRGLAESIPGVEVEDLRGRLLLPGLIDAHHHLSISALHPRWADVSGAGTLEDLGHEICATAVGEAGADWVRAVGWNDVPHGLVPHRRDLDELGLERPVIVAHYTLHQCVVSSAGLDRLGITDSTPDPPGGVIGRDRDGEPNGLLVERAWSQAHAASLAAYSDPQSWGAHIAAGARSLLAEGITCVHDAACSPEAEQLYRALAARGELPISVLVMPHPAALLAPLTTRLDGPVTGEGDESVRVGPVKLFADGGVAPAIDATLRGERMTAGMSFGDLGTQVRAVVERGFRVAVHAIGNEGLASALDAFEASTRRHDGDSRFRIEHATLASSEQIHRLAGLGGVAVVQPGFLHHMGQAVERFTFDDATWMAFGDLLGAGVALAASSDAPCAFHHPLRASALGVSRRTGSGGVLGADQALGFEEWLRAYTVGAAFAGGQEAERGSLTAGKRADLAVLAGELDPVRPAVVAQTWVGGELVYEAP